MSAVKFSLKLPSANMKFVNCFGLKNSLEFQNTEELSSTEKLSSGVSQKLLFNIDEAVMKCLNLSISGSKSESVTCKFTKNRTPSQLLFKEFHYTCRTGILKNATWWLLLRKTLFWNSWIAAFQRQPQSRNSRSHVLHILLWRHVKEERIFMDFFLSSGFDEKCKLTELA